jgi:hypothetical protein
MVPNHKIRDMTKVDKLNWILFGAFMTSVVVAAVYNSLTVGTECAF